MKDYSLKTMRHLSKQQQTDLAMLLRYRTLTPKKAGFVYTTLREIAELLGRSQSWVHKALQARVAEVRQTCPVQKKSARERASPPVHYKWKRYNYSQGHKDWLASPHVLKL